MIRLDVELLAGRCPLSTTRYSPDSPIPEIPYLPGITARNSIPLLCKTIPAGGWAVDPQYHYGIDLFNHGCHWEAHEAWESRWLSLISTELYRTHLQGLIQASAALLKIRQEQPRPARTIWQRGRRRLEVVIEQVQAPQQFGIDLNSLLPSIDSIDSNATPQFITPCIEFGDH